MKTIFAAAAAVAAFAAAAPALANSDAMTVSGSVAPVCTISAPTDATVTLTTTSAQNLGNVTLQCNDPQGFTGSVASANGGQLRNTEAPSSYRTYQLSSSAGLTAFTPTTEGQPAFNSVNYSANAAAINGLPIPVAITVGAQFGPAYAGTYSDVLTFTVNAN